MERWRDYPETGWRGEIITKNPLDGEKSGEVGEVGENGWIGDLFRWIK
jgi:hypothetical protein